MKGVAAARTYLARQLKDRPSVRGEAALIDLTLAEQADPLATLHDLKHITDQLLVRNPSYRCTRCGFGARSHHWQCPSCKEWGTVKPLLELRGGLTACRSGSSCIPRSDVVGTWLARRYAIQRQLIDHPGERRSHAVPTPRGGGVAIVIALLVAACVLGWRNPHRCVVPVVRFIVGLLLVAGIGMVDDHRPLSLGCGWASKGWLLPSSRWLSRGPGVDLSLALIAFVAVMALTNIWNFMDGINGIAGTPGGSGSSWAGARRRRHLWAGWRWRWPRPLSASCPSISPRPAFSLGMSAAAPWDSPWARC